MVLVCGEALIDMIPESDREVYRVAPGGSPYNVARALGRLGANPYFLCPFSSDRFGRILRKTAEESGVDLSIAPEVRALSTLGFVTTRPSDGKVEYAFYTEGTAGLALRAENLPATPESVRAAHVGSFSLGIEPFASAVDRLLDREKERLLVSVDPNIRPFLIEDRDLFEARLDRVIARADVLKISDEDLEWLRPGQDQEVFCDELLERGLRLVVVTRGAKGALGKTRAVRSEIEGVKVEIADTVGAGDTFQAGLLFGLARRDALSKSGPERLSAEELTGILEFANLAAAKNCERVGCNPPTLKEMESATNSG